MKVAIVSNHAKKSKEVAAELMRLLANAQIPINQEQPTVVITVGGDGTLLSAFHKYHHLIDDVRFIGVHTGHLGFYTDWRDYELGLLVSSLQEDQGQSVSYPLLDVQLTFNDGTASEVQTVLNEATIRNTVRTMVAKVAIKDDCFEMYRGDGLSVSTPTGSTAYSKSLGGAVVHPRVNALQLNEIASINNRVYRSLGSPMIIAPDEWITIELKQDDHYQLHLDHYVRQYRNLCSLKLALSQKRIHFVSYRHTHFWSRVNDAFIGTVKDDD
ncbi:NAD kinase [Vagococcus penaei]|uniref:NAD kinase n=1 Tax=Vagococcus penaei TaxID=633807 RepID=A0A1Q2D786_9ENTE|nr:NAD kinase [Vagococcus penaei]AQP54163.1 NAD kinase [Vagococcus penaei]RSU02162.1 NAD kinase [Vagococcus penaei]